MNRCILCRLDLVCFRRLGHIHVYAIAIDLNFFVSSYTIHQPLGAPLDPCFTITFNYHLPMYIFIAGLTCALKN